MNQITNVPDSVSSAGLNFNYAVWTAGTVVTLVNAPWTSDYRDIVSKDTSIDAWIDRQKNKLVVNNMRHMRLNQPVKIDAPFEVAAQFNYIRATNPAQPVQGSLPSTYYYFIQSVEYGAPNTTILNVQLDVWATFRNNVTIGRAYVERGHIGIANRSQNSIDGWRTYLTVPEGLEVGAEMIVAQTWHHEIASARGKSFTDTNYSIMVTTSVDLEQTPTSEENAKVVTATGSQLENLPNGGGIYIFDDKESLGMFLTQNKDRAWITQGITSIMAVPPIETMGYQTSPASIPGLPSGAVKKFLGGTPAYRSEVLAKDWIQKHPVPDRYRHLTKFFTYPYTVLEMTTFNGQPLILKPELITNAGHGDLSKPDERPVVVRTLFHLNPGSARLTFYPAAYNKFVGSNGADWNNSTVYHDSGEFLDFSCHINNFPMFSVVNNSYAAFMASNRNQIAYQHTSAKWDQQRAMMGAQTAMNNAQSGLEMTGSMNQADQARISQNANLANLTAGRQGAVDLVQGGISAGNQVLHGDIVGGLLNGVSSMGGAAANTMIQQDNNTRSASIQAGYANAATSASLTNQTNVMYNNVNYARQAAKGDYANAIAGIQAKVQDAQMLQPTTSGQVGGESFNLAQVGWAVFIRLKTISPLAFREVGEYWLRYGYVINRWIDLPENLMVMSKMTYWKVVDAQVFADGCPEEYRMTIRGILEKGVTCWKNPDEIGRIDPATNTPLEGIVY